MKYFNLVLTLAIMGVLYSCYPKGPEYVDELDIVISKYDSDKFPRPGTFAMPDQVVYLKDGELDEEHPHDKDDLLLSQIEDHMKNNGFELVNNLNPGDTTFIVIVEVLETTNVGYIWPPYYGPDWGWDPWYPWYPGGWYPYYPWYPSYYAFKTGTVRIQLGDWENRSTNEDGDPSIEYVYLGALNGLLEGTESYIDARVKAGIDQLFNQDPFPITAN